MNKGFLAALVLLFSIAVTGQQLSPGVQYKLITGNNIIASKNYYLLTLLQNNKAVSQMIAHDSIFSVLLKNKWNQIKGALTECKEDLTCFTDRIQFSDEEISLVSERFAALYSADNALGILVQKHLVPSGTYILYQHLTPKEQLIKAWQQDAHGINFLIGVYAAGKKANYPNIDSIAFNVKDRRYTSLVYNVIYSVLGESAGNQLFFVPSLTAALRFLEINERNNAADYEPLATGENRGATDRIKTIQWNNYKYSVIMIPGAGPEEPTVALSAEGMLRCRLAAIQFKKGLAPFIVTSGGKVHPYKTKYCEAIEMKKYLVEQLQIPANAVIIDPHARHTTTNMRNTVRLIYRYGIPFNKSALSCTTRGQSNMIESTLIARCMKELGETPYKNGARLSETEMEFYPLREALQINPLEPMDP
jgi:uncharacterized SAM-binding protein YcdF (DUF218 family)